LIHGHAGVSTSSVVSLASTAAHVDIVANK
jgi:hypothetical protein